MCFLPISAAAIFVSAWLSGPKAREEEKGISVDLRHREARLCMVAGEGLHDLQGEMESQMTFLTKEIS